MIVVTLPSAYVCVIVTVEVNDWRLGGVGKVGGEKVDVIDSELDELETGVVGGGDDVELDEDVVVALAVNVDDGGLIEDIVLGELSVMKESMKLVDVELVEIGSEEVLLLEEVDVASVPVEEALNVIVFVMLSSSLSTAFCTLAEIVVRMPESDCPLEVAGLEGLVVLMLLSSDIVVVIPSVNAGGVDVEAVLLVTGIVVGTDRPPELPDPVEELTLTP